MVIFLIEIVSYGITSPENRNFQKYRLTLCERTEKRREVRSGRDNILLIMLCCCLCVNFYLWLSVVVEVVATQIVIADCGCDCGYRLWLWLRLRQSFHNFDISTIQSIANRFHEDWRRYPWGFSLLSTNQRSVPSTTPMISVLCNIRDQCMVPCGPNIKLSVGSTSILMNSVWSLI